MREREFKELMRKHAPEFVAAIEEAQRLGVFATAREASQAPEKLLVVGGIYDNVDNSIKAVCERCEKNTYLSPSTQAMLAQRKGPSEIICWTCMEVEMAEQTKAMEALLGEL